MVMTPYGPGIFSLRYGVEGFGEPNYLKGKGLGPVIELIPEGDGQIDLS